MRNLIASIMNKSKTPIFFGAILILFASFMYFEGYQEPSALINIEPIDQPEQQRPPRPDVNGLFRKPFTLKAGKKKISIQKLSVETEIVQDLALTTLDIIFHNDSNAVLNGELEFPLAENESISRLAIEVNGKLREGVVVDKKTARVAYENTIRQRIDPAIAEQTKGNVFKTQVYPIPARGTKRLVIAYTQKLIKKSADDYYSLPLFFNEKLDELNIHIKARATSQPVVSRTDIENLVFESWEKSFEAKKTLKNYKSNTQIVIRLPRRSQENQVKTLVENFEGTNYFYHSTYLTPKRLLKEKLLKEVTVVWDVSLSSAKRNLDKDIDLLNKYLKSKKVEKVELITFHFNEQSKKYYDDIDALLSDLRKLKMDGATNLTSIDFGKIKTDQILLFTDGMNNFNVGKISIGKTPIHVICSNAIKDAPYMKSIAKKSGGMYVNLLDGSLGEALRLMSSNPYKFQGYEIIKGKVEQVYPSKGSMANGAFHLSGHVKEQTKIKLKYGYGNEVDHTEIIEIKPSDKKDLEKILVRQWANEKIAELNEDYEIHKDMISSLGKEFGIVTKATSLIVLDRLQDYVNHGIEPPIELQNQWYKDLVSRRENNKVEEKAAFNNHMEKVKRDFKRLITWYEKWDPNKVKKEELKKHSTDTLRMDFNIDNDLRGNTDGIDQRPEPSYDMDISVPSEANYNFSAEEESEDLEEISNTGTARREVGIQARLKSNASPNFTASEKFKSLDKSVEAKTKIKTWSSDMKYMDDFKDLDAKEIYDKYYEVRSTYEDMPAYYLDVAQLLWEKGKKQEAIRVVSNLAELKTENHEILRALAMKLDRWNEMDLALSVFEEVLKMREEEPQSHRDLGLAYHKAGKDQEAIERLYEVVKKDWHNRFPGIETIVLDEINNIISMSEKKLDTYFMDEELVYPMGVDLRVTLEWNYDNTDIDLWVIDPKGEKCFYSHKNTKTGGRMSNDFTRGYGPEEFMIRNAVSGKYKIKVNYYGSRRQKISGPPALSVKIITNYGKSNQSVQMVDLRLKDKKEVVYIGEVLIE